MSSFIILYADDIVLLAQSVGELQHILSVCERELSWLDMNINSNKSCVGLYELVLVVILNATISQPPAAAVYHGSLN